MDYEKLSVKADEIISEFNKVSSEIKAMEKQLNGMKELKNNIINYMKTKDAYTEYKKSGYSKKMYAKYESELILHKAARAYFDKMKLEKLPSIKSLQTKEQQLFNDKNQAYSRYKKAKNDMQEIATIKANVESILNIKPPKKAQVKTQEAR